MGYNLWLASRRELEEYYYKRMGNRYVDGQLMLGDSILSEPLELIIDGKRKRDFTLDEIDSFVCGFKNLDDVRRHFRLFDEYKDFADNEGRLYIASKYDNIDKFQVIYNNPLLKKCAMLIREKRRNGLPEFLDRTPEMRNYVKTLVGYAVSKNSESFIIDSSLLPPHVQKKLRYYVEGINNNDQQMANANFEELFGYCMNYKTLRAFVIIEEKYLERVAKRRADLRSRKSEEAAVRRQMMYEYDLRSTPLDSPILAKIDNMRDEDGNIDFDRVYSQYDFDDIHSQPSRELQALGIIPMDDGGSKKKGHKKK